MAVRYWRTLRDGEPDNAILAFDFPLGRIDAGFADLVPLLDTSGTVLEFTPLSGTPGSADLMPDAYLDRLLVDLLEGRPDLQVRNVLAFCAGSTLACSFAEAFREKVGRSLPVTLVNPEVEMPGALRYKFQQSVRVLEKKLAPGEADKICEAGRIIAHESGLSIYEVARQLSKLYHDTVLSVFSGLGDAEVYAEELSGRFRDFMAYLAVAHSLQFRPWQSTITTVATRDRVIHYPAPAGSRYRAVDVLSVHPMENKLVAAAVSAELAK